MIPIFIINLKHSEKRLKIIAGNLKECGYDAIRVEATDGKQLGSTELALCAQDQAIILHNRTLTNGEIGCALSHIRIYHHIVVHNIPYSIIFEDDAMFNSTLFGFANAVIKMDIKFDVVNFCSDAPIIPLPPIIYGMHRLAAFASYANRATAYLVSLRGARKLLNSGLPIRYAADGLLGRPNVSNIALYGVTPNLATFADTPSEIDIVDAINGARNRYAK